MSFILVAPLKHMVNWERSPIFRIKEAQIIRNQYIVPKWLGVEPEQIDSIANKIDIPTVVFKGCPNHTLNSEFTAENVIFEDCEDLFAWKTINTKNFPNVSNIYLPSYHTQKHILSYYLPKLDTKITENLTIFIKQRSNDNFACLTDTNNPKICKYVIHLSIRNFEERMNNLCQTMLHPKECIYENSSTLKMNSRYSS